MILEHEKGTYIVLFTARNMRTFKGAIGLINKYTAPVVLEWLNKYNIPYDEIIFGKPWGNEGFRRAKRGGELWLLGLKKLGKPWDNE